MQKDSDFHNFISSEVVLGVMISHPIVFLKPRVKPEIPIRDYKLWKRHKMDLNLLRLISNIVVLERFYEPDKVEKLIFLWKF